MTTPAAATRQNVTLPVIPQLYLPEFLDSLLPIKQQVVYDSVAREPEPTNPMMAALKATAHQTLTDNGAPAYSATLSPVLDAFNVLRPWAQGSDLTKYLDAAWKEDPQLTLRIIWHTRSIHDGKGENEVFYQAFGWLYEHHPRTALGNLPQLVEPLCKRAKSDECMSHGYWKDLLHILALATLDTLRPWNKPPAFLHSPRGRLQVRNTEKLSREDKALANHERLVAKLAEPKFRALYVSVARLFADKLAQDLRVLENMEKVAERTDEWWALLRRLSLAGKWAPTPQGSHDRVTNIATAIALLLHDAGVTHPLQVNATRDASAAPLDAHILRSFYQRWVLTPLRGALAVPEPLMSANRWKEIQYSRVASRCMKLNAEHFFRHDTEGFEAYMLEVESGKKKISGATLMPHEIVQHVIDASQGSGRERGALAGVKKKVADMQVRVLEAQWATLVQRLRESGRLDSAVAVCDVSGSMFGEPIYVALALSLVTAQLARPPFNGGFITFSKDPQFVTVDVEKDGLAQTFIGMQNSAWGMNTDFHAIFVRLLLPLAVKHNVKPEDMIKTVFVFSDMQFDQAASADASAWETSHDVVVKAYEEAGYEVPRIVYWDLARHTHRGMTAVPVTAKHKGVALLNGFSPALLKVFMGEQDAEAEGDWDIVDNEEAAESEEIDAEFDPVSIMKKAVMKKSFDGLVVVD